MFNFIKSKQDYTRNSDEQCCCEDIANEQKKAEPCCGCSCGDSTPATDKGSCCRE